jgi:phosphoesterase RecJ-like protein
VDDGKAEYDLAILFDCRTPGRLGVDAAALSRCAAVLVIDHHPPADDEESAGEDWIVVPAPATTLLALSMINALGGIESVSADVATNLYAGLVVDTGGFRHPSTTASALRAGGLLVDRGADAPGITELLLHRRRPEAVRLLGLVLQVARYEAEGRVVLIGVGQSELKACGARTAEAEGLISIASSIEGVALAVMHLEFAPGQWRVSLRAHQPWRVDRMARAYGGGGHVLASGFRAEGDLAELQAGLLPSLVEELAAGDGRS